MRFDKSNMKNIILITINKTFCLHLLQYILGSHITLLCRIKIILKNHQLFT